MNNKLPSNSQGSAASTDIIYVAKPPMLIKIISWACIAFFLLCSFITMSTNQYLVSIFFLLFVALGVYLLLTSGELNMSSEEIISITPIGKYRMLWEEVETIELDSKKSNLVFFSENRSKRIAVIGPLYWYGSDKQRLSELLSEQVQKYRIPIKRSIFAGYITSKNTRADLRSPVGDSR